jgi:hypothetical protein
MRMRSGWNAADSSSSSVRPRPRKTLRRRGGGNCRAGSCAMRWLRLVYGLRICADFLLRRRIWARIAARWIRRDADAAEESLTEARRRGGGAAAREQVRCRCCGGVSHGGTEARRGSCALDQARCGCCGEVSHGGTEARRGSCRAGSGAMPWLRLVYELRICADLRGGAEGGCRADSCAMPWRRLVYELRISRICAEAQRGSCRADSCAMRRRQLFFCV